MHDEKATATLMARRRAAKRAYQEVDAVMFAPRACPSCDGPVVGFVYYDGRGTRGVCQRCHDESMALRESGQQERAEKAFLYGFLVGMVALSISLFAVLKFLGVL